MISRKNSGMTLIEIVVALAVFGMLATVFASSFAEVFKAQKLVESKDRSNDLASSVGRFLYKGSSCAQGLKDVDIPTGDTKNDLILNNFVGFGSVTPSAFGKGTVIDNVLRVKEFTISDSGIAPENIASGGVTYTRIHAKIELNLEIFNQGEWKEVPPRFFEIPVFTNAARKIQRCSVEMLVDDACQVLGSTFDASTGLCVPNTQCIMKGHFIQNSCSPSTSSCPSSQNVVNTFTGNLSCPSDSVKSETGKFTWSYDESCGKKCTRPINVTQEFYICLRCD